MKQYIWNIRFMDNKAVVHHIKGCESKESLAIKKVFSILSDKSFCLSVLDSYVYCENTDEFVSINPLSKKVQRVFDK